MFSRMLPQMQKALKHPEKAYKFAIWKIKEKLLWDFYYKAIREPKIKSSVSGINNEVIIEELKENGLKIIDFKINVTHYKQYINNAEYHKVQSFYGISGKRNVFSEKSLEHYLAAKLLNLSKNDVYIDIANAYSPAPEIYNKLYGCKVYKQDLVFRKGIHGNTIGGDAGHMPIADGFATSMALHCSFEHFEQDADIKFIKEASRVLKKGGKLCILPLYLFEKYAIQTDPTMLSKGSPHFESEAILYCAKGYGNRHGRFYDVPHFISRVVNNLNDLNLTIYVVQNEKEVDPSCYVKFIALFEKE
jgi:SAM-dependent methyltransferase